MLFHLLRLGTRPDAIAFRKDQSYSAYGAKVVAWTEIPNDDSLNGRCIVIPMQETSRTDLLGTSHSKVIVTADELQKSLLRFRFDHYLHPLSGPLPHVPLVEQLRSRERDLYKALAIPIRRIPSSCENLLYCLVRQKYFQGDPLPARQVAVLENLFKEIHAQPEQEYYALRNLTIQTNLNLTSSGERFRLNEKNVSGLLKSFGFLNRKRTNSGWVVLIDRAARALVHRLASDYGLNTLSPDLISKPCEFCNVQKSDEGAESRLMEFDFKPPEYPSEIPIRTSEDEESLLIERSALQWEMLGPDWNTAETEELEELKTAPVDSASELGPDESPHRELESSNGERRERGEHKNNVNAQDSHEAEPAPAKAASEVPPETGAPTGSSNGEHPETSKQKGEDVSNSTYEIPWILEDGNEGALKKQIIDSMIERENHPPDLEDLP